MIAGYVHGMKDHFSAGQKFSGYLKKYVVDLYLPCIYFSLAYWLLKYFLISPLNNSLNFTEGLTFTSTHLYLIPLTGIREYWFICTLFFVKVIHVAFEGLFRRANVNALFWCIAFIAARFCGMKIFYSTAIFSYGLYFHIGFMMKRKDIISESRHPAAIWGLSLFVAGFMFFLFPYMNDTSNAFTGTAAALFMSIALIMIFYAFGIKNRFLAYCGVFSMVIYALHLYIISFMRFSYRFAGLSSTVNSAILYFVCFIAALFVPLLVIKLYQNVKCFRWIEYIFYPGKLLPKSLAVHQVKAEHAHSSSDKLPQ